MRPGALAGRHGREFAGAAFGTLHGWARGGVHLYFATCRISFFFNEYCCCFRGENFSGSGREELGVIGTALCSERPENTLASAACVRHGRRQNRLPAPGGPGTQGVSFRYCRWWLQALGEDKTCLYAVVSRP